MVFLDMAPALNDSIAFGGTKAMDE